jgi:hypothetical protein
LSIAATCQGYGENKEDSEMKMLVAAHQNCENTNQEHNKKKNFDHRFSP